ncbi:MAG TPA: hypothetical protein VFX59_11290, partial [Polyangiales bacterium]|nr:hypothetical protein [Polyangiales bacterium]
MDESVELARISGLLSRLLGEHSVSQAERALRFSFRDVAHTLVVFDQGRGPTALIAVALARPVSKERGRELLAELHSEWRFGILEESDCCYLAASAPAALVTMVGVGRCIETLARAITRVHSHGRVPPSGTRRLEGAQGSWAATPAKR